MRAHEFLSESVSSVVYHYTNLPAARKILTSGDFQLSSVLGSVEQQYAPRGYPYFLSTTRTRRGGYHDAGFGANHGVLFELDGAWYNRHYPGGAVDYWGNRDPQQSHHRKHETEDRIYSREPVISAGGVRSVHVLATGDAEPNQRAQARAVMIAAKKQGIPAYYYDDQSAWLNQDTRKTADVRQLTGQDAARGYVSRRPGYLEPWLELVSAKNQSQLSKKADSIRYNLGYTYNRQSAAQGLGTDLSNARKPDSGADRENAVKLISYMRQQRINTVSELVDHLATKWSNKTVSESTDIPAVLYHATYRPLLSSIKQHGLGGSGSEQKRWEDSMSGTVYLAANPDIAESYAETSETVPDEWLDDIVILTVDTNKLDPSKFSMDVNVLDNTGDTVEYHGIIPPSAIST